MVVTTDLAIHDGKSDVGVDIKTACDALTAFDGVKRRMELIGEVNNISVYDDFAHHPTAIKTTLEGLRKKVGNRKIWGLLNLAQTPCVWVLIKIT